MAASMFELLPHLITIFERLEYLWNLNTLLVEFYCNKSKQGQSQTILSYNLVGKSAIRANIEELFKMADVSKVWKQQLRGVANNRATYCDPLYGTW